MADVAETVFILGAGASVGAGAPLMSNFLDVAEDLMHDRRGGVSRAGEDLDAFEQVFAGIDALQGVFAKGTIDRRNLESVFGAFEMARLLGRLGSLELEQIKQLPDAMRRVIQKTLELTVRFERSSRDNVEFPGMAAHYGEFVDLVRRAITTPEGTDWSRACVITFNYDLCVDRGLSLAELKVDYALTDEPPSEGLRFLKLHGSLNWIRCDTCKKIAVVPDVWSKDWTIGEGGNGAFLATLKALRAFTHCGASASSEALIVPPTWSKAEYHVQLESVWRAAARELSGAQRIFVFGYSLPPTDEFFRLLYAIGSTGPGRLRSFGLINPDSGAGSRFQAILGEEARPRFWHHVDTFRSGVDYLRQNGLTARG
jgi:hypothetical protein